MKRLFTSDSVAAPQPAAAPLARRTVQGGLALLLLLGATAARPAQAQPGQPLVTVENADAESIRVRVANPGQQPSRVQIVRLATRNTVFAETYSAPTYGHRFNFRDLRPGRYALLMNVGPEAYRYVLQVDNNSACRGAVVRTVKARGPKSTSLATASL
ncbi:hypothetical protein [Hymenobacter sp. CRA2]|uniref:hypothetical protein n=1 Tax=Hymenobacter sp. CRA2 TaxID=1955620 RepID=UPI00098EC334|nr:hypothetical protein [Hymenobacter sp. CRA2]OON71103.1 hypothetical protein B0919_03695 [Hymenobacter sp. CRA2]